MNLYVQGPTRTRGVEESPNLPQAIKLRRGKGKKYRGMTIKFCGARCFWREVAITCLCQYKYTNDTISSKVTVSQSQSWLSAPTLMDGRLRRGHPLLHQGQGSRDKIRAL